MQGYPIHIPEFVEALRIGAQFEHWVIWHDRTPKAIDGERTTVLTMDPYTKEIEVDHIIPEPPVEEGDTEQVWPVQAQKFGDGCNDIYTANEIFREIHTILGIAYHESQHNQQDDEPHQTAFLLDGVLVFLKTIESMACGVEIQVKLEVFPSTYPDNLRRIGKLIWSVFSIYEKLNLCEMTWAGDAEDVD